jgi:CelD/BcsL family acetyltransferase involved in cellulose biosynthesis
MNFVHSKILHADDESPQTGPAADAARLGMASSAAPGIHLMLYDRLDAIEPAWSRFETSADCTVFQTFDYLAAWQKHIGARQNIVPAIVVARQDNGEILFLLPLGIDGRGMVRRLRWLGHDLGDYLAPVLGTDFPRALPPARFALVWQEICALLQSDPRFAHDMIELCKMPKTVGNQPNPFAHVEVALHPSAAHLVNLTGDWEAFYAAKRSASTRRRDRTKRKRLAEHGEIRLTAPTADDEIVRTVEALIRGKSESLAHMGAPDLFMRPGVREFYLDLATNPRTRELVHVSRLEAGSAAVAINLGLQYRSRYYYVLASYDHGEISRCSPGAVHLRELMQRAIELGFGEFDFTIGDESYKYEWCDTETLLSDRLAAVTARGWFVVAPYRAFSRLKRAIKRTPILWRAYRGIRAEIGSLQHANRAQLSPKRDPSTFGSSQ